MASGQATVAALGRPFKLGMLYDARMDRLIQGAALLDPSTLQRATHRRPQPYSDFTMSASDSMSEKASLLEVHASLKASVLCGFVEADGSAKFLHDRRRFQNQSRVTLRYKATTHFQQLALTAADWGALRDRGARTPATHVVTGIEYGANAFFVFDSQILAASDVQEFKLKIQAVIHLIFWSVHFDFERDLTEEQKALVKQLKVKFHSDFLLVSPPATFIEAVQTYREMSERLGRDGENAVPVKVWMMPLRSLDPAAAAVVRSVSLGLVIRAESVLEDLSEVMMRCNDCLSVSAVGKLPQLHKQLHQFHQLCHYYTLELQRRMAEACPAIRDGTESESVLRGVFQKRLTSAFSQDRLTMWLQDKEREVNVVQSCLEVLEGVPVLSSQAQVDRFVMSPEHLVCSGLVFTSLRDTDPQLEDMSRNLKALETATDYELPPQESDQIWFYSRDTVARLRDTAEGLAKTPGPVFIAAVHADGHQGAALVKYRNGEQAGGTD